MFKLLISLCILLFTVVDIDAQVKKYEPNWSSLNMHTTPQWLKDAKFGIYTHVTLQTVKNLPGNENKWEHELIPNYKLENFSAAQWAKLFKDAGAKFAGPVAWHGSSFLQWDSDLTEWDIAEKGPQFDFSGELKREIEAHGMKFMMSFHSTDWYRKSTWQNPERANPAYKDLYGPLHDNHLLEGKDFRYEKQSRMSNEYASVWLNKMKEAVTKYEPDLVWADLFFGGTLRAHNWGRAKDGKLLTEGHQGNFGTGDGDIYLFGVPEYYQTEFLSHFYNTGLINEKDVEFVYKEHDIPVGVGMRDIENGLISELAYDTWMTDIDMCLPFNWFYKEGMTFRDANNIIDILADVTSRNGILLLNVPPKADGTFDEKIVKELNEVGDWLKLNGEAIYGTIPWSFYGEGPSVLKETGHYSEGKVNASYTEEDFRFTQNEHSLYVICLGIPKGEITIRTLGSRGRLVEGDIISVELLGSDRKIKYSQNPMELKIQMPENFEASHACVFKIERRK